VDDAAEQDVRVQASERLGRRTTEGLSLKHLRRLGQPFADHLRDVGGPGKQIREVQL
jgi:hypothetical protein